MARRRAPEAFSDQLRRLINDSGLTRYRIWKDTGISQPTLSRFLAGTHGLSLAAVEVLIKYLNLELVKRGEQ